MLIPDCAQTLFSIFAAEGEELYLVGGVVRDWMIKQSAPEFNLVPDSNDLDFATSALPAKTKAILQKHCFPVYEIGAKFGTIGTKLTHEGIELTCDITTYRCEESYRKGDRKPEVVFGKSLDEDLKRRDFTINSVALNAQGELLDPFDGSKHVKEKMLVTTQHPFTAFGDDPLRMMRLFRFCAQLGFDVYIADYVAVFRMKHHIHDISKERVFSEMSRLLMSSKPSAGLRPMAECGLLGEIFPALQKVVDFRQNQGEWHSKLVWPHTMDVVDRSVSILAVRWAALFHDVAKPQTYEETDTGVHFHQHERLGAEIWLDVAKQLKVSKALRDEVHFLILNHLRPGLLAANGFENVTPKALRRLAIDAGPYLDNLFHLSLADISSHKPDVVAEKLANCIALRVRIDMLDEVPPQLPTGLGDAIAKKLNIEKGPRLGTIMKRLRDMFQEGAVAEEDLLSTAERLHAEYVS